MMYFTVWVVVCVIPACCFFFIYVSMKRLLPAYFDKKGKKSIVSVFSSTYFLFVASSLLVGLARLAIFILFVSLSVSWIESPGLLGCIRKLNFNSFFFTSTNYFRRQLSSRRNNLKLLSSEFSLWTIFYTIENRLAFIHRRSLDIVDLQRLDWIWCSSFTTFHLTSGKEISSLFKGETSSGSLVTHSVDLSEDLKFISSLFQKVKEWNS